MSDFKIPPNPTPNVVVVTNIAPDVTEPQLREFFVFCGDIKQFQLSKCEDGTQKALIEFTRESAARTALLLTNATLGERSIVVGPYFDDLPPYSVAAEESEREEKERLAAEGANPQLRQEDKPKLSIVIEMLANGYILNEKIMENAKTFDEKHGISKSFQNFLEKSKEFEQKYHVVETGQKIGQEVTAQAVNIAQNLDEKFLIQKRAHEVDEKYHVSEKLNEALKMAEQAANSETGQKIQGYMSYIWKTASDTLAEAKKKAVEKNPELMAKSSAAQTVPAPEATTTPASTSIPEKS